MLIIPKDGELTIEPPTGDPRLISLATTGVEAGTYNQVTVDAKGRITAGANTPDLAGGPAGGDLTGTYPNPTLAAILTAGGPTGDATHVPAVTYDAKGRLTAVSSVAIALGATGDATGTLPGALTLASVLTAGGPTGSSTTIPVVTWDAKGRLTAVSSATIGHTADATFYVRTDGSDSNDGSANDSEHAFLTIQKACNVVGARMIPGGVTITIQIADGTYTITQPITLPKFAGAGLCIIKGNISTPANVIVTNATDFSPTTQGIFHCAGPGPQVRVQDLKLTATGRCRGLCANSGGYLEFGNINFGAFSGTVGDHILAIANGIVIAVSNYTVSGSAVRHWNASAGGIIRVAGFTVTVSGTPVFSSAFANSTQGSMIDAGSSTAFSGSATGKRFTTSFLGVIIANGDPLLFPGDTAGTAATGGLADTIQSPWQLLSKASTQTIINSSTLTNDTDLTFAMLANTNYRIRGVIFFDTTATADYKFAFTGPTSPTLVRAMMIECPASGTPNFVAMATALPGSRTLGSASASGGYWSFEMVFHNGANAGTFAVQFAQDSATNDTGAKHLAGCHMEYMVA